MCYSCRVPDDPWMRKKWKLYLKLTELSRGGHVCSKHNLESYLATLSIDSCSVPECKNDDKEYEMLQFPQEGTNTLEFQKWVENIMNFNGATEEHIKALTSSSRICPEHFESKCFTFLRGKKYLRYGSVPTLNLPGKISIRVALAIIPIILSRR